MNYNLSCLLSVRIQRSKVCGSGLILCFFHDKSSSQFLKVYEMNILDNFKGLLFCVHTFGVWWGELTDQVA